MNSSITALSFDPANLFGILFNLLIIAAVGGLWLMWARSMERQKNVETLLAASSAQLAQASGHLESALQEIRKLQAQQAGQVQHSSSTETVDDRTAESDPEFPQGLSHPMHAYRQAQSTPGDPIEEEAIAQAATGFPAADPTTGAAAPPAVTDAREDGQSDVQRIIHLHDLGLSAELIASQMDMPLARIKLLLRLHLQRSGGPESR